MRANVKSWGSLVAVSFREWKKNYCQLAAAALSFFTLFSLTPLLIILLTIINYIGHPLPDTRLILRELSSVIGAEEGRPVRHWLRVTMTAREQKATVYSLIFLLIGASTVFVHLQRTLDIIWQRESNRKGALRRFVKSRMASIGLVGV